MSQMTNCSDQNSPEKIAEALSASLSSLSDAAIEAVYFDYHFAPSSFTDSALLRQLIQSEVEKRGLWKEHPHA